jgi:CheY-like chemotaxis protein
VEHKTKPLFSRDRIESLPKGTETILLVEDEFAVRELAGRVLREQGYTVLEAVNGEEALRLFQKNEEKEIHLLLADVVMPQLGGPELANRLAAKRPDLKVLFISGYTNSTTFPHNLGAKNTAFLSKPFPPEALARKVREVLDN